MSHMGSSSSSSSSLYSECALLQYAVKGLSIADVLQRSPATEVIRAGSCHYRAWQRMPLVAKTQLDLYASPLTMRRPSLIKAPILSKLSEVEREYARINDGVLELWWNLKLSPEFQYNLLIL